MTKETTRQEEFKVSTYLSVSKIAVYILYGWVMLGTILLGLRVFLLVFSANATAPFVDFVYRTSADYLAPFRGIFPARQVGEAGYLDIAAIFAIIIYLLVAWGLRSLITHVSHRIELEEIEHQAKVVRARKV